jgi:hypothetical protein
MQSHYRTVTAAGVTCTLVDAFYVAPPSHLPFLPAPSPPPPHPQVRVCFKRLVRLLQGSLLELDPLGITLTLRHLAALGAADPACRVSLFQGGVEQGVV